MSDRRALDAVMLGAVALAMMGCAHANRGATPWLHLSSDAGAGWAALLDGRSNEAASAFTRRLDGDGADAQALFGRGTVAFDRGDHVRAVEDYARLLQQAALSSGDDAAGALAPVAAGRLLTLLSDLPDGPLVRQLEDRVLSLPRARLPWTAQHELGRLGDRAARRRMDPALIEQLALTTGCARLAYQAGMVGRLPRVDLDAVDGTAVVPAAEWRPVASAGCRLSVSSWDGRSGVQLVKAAVDVSAAGTFELVLDFASEARWRIDGGAWQRHGLAVATGPTVSATALRLPTGRHTIELRLGTLGGDAELSLMLLPPAAGAAARFVDPRAGATIGAGASIVGLVSATAMVSAPLPEVSRAIFDYAAAYVADRVGDADGAAAAVARLSARPRFAAGLVLAGGVVQNDVTRPGSFARDAGQTLLRRAVAVDPTLARAWNVLANLELDDEHPRESIEDARAAIRAAPEWTAPELTLAAALSARGLEFDADQALDRAASKAMARPATPGRASCAAGEALVRRAEQRRDVRAREALLDQLRGCDSRLDGQADRLRGRGDVAGALAWLRQVAALSPRQNDWRAQIATLLLASGQASAAVTELRALLERTPRDVRLRIQLADALTAAGQPAAARQTLVQLLAAQPSALEARQVARAVGLPLPLDPYRVDGAAIIAAFRASGRRYDAPSVVVLDRSVARVSASGEQMMLTHNIVLVQTKEGIDHWGEVAVSDNAEILFLRTHKPDGTTREAEQISGKDTISAADLAIGDYLEWETLETKPASDAFPGGFLGDRFFFRSFDAPLDRSEFIMVTPAGMPLDIDRRVGAPQGVRSDGPEGTVVTRFATGQIPQLFAERSSVPAIAYVPSVRISSGVTWAAWTRFLREQLYGTTRTSPALRALAASLAREAQERDPASTSAAAAKASDPGRLAAAIVAWVTSHIEAADELRDPASLTLARGRGNRLALVLALARELKLPARVVLARSRLAGDGRGAGSPQELEEFSEPLVAFELDGGSDGIRTIYADVRLRYAAFGYLPPNLDGAHILALDSARLGQAESRGWSDQRTVDMTIRLDEEGGAQVLATEELSGWPALEWAELIDRLGADRARLRQDFEQRWLGVNFPGARLKDLQVDFLSDGGPRPTATAAAAAGSRAVRLRYSFFSPNFGLRSEGELKLSPTFFRSQPGRRFAAEPTRQTTLMMGYDVPLRMTAIVQLPHTAQVVGAPTAPAAGVVSRRDGYRFVEERTARPGAPDVLILHREAALPIMRVSPEDYGGVAADLRRVDSLEQQEIRIRLPAAHGGVAP